MKNFLFTTFCMLSAFYISAQGSLIADIMKVEPVNLTIGEEDQKLVDEYDATYTEELAALDELLQEQSEDYAADITELIQDFTEMMEKGEEQLIKNEKQKVNTMSNSKTYSLIKDKKRSIQSFHNTMSSEMRELPRPIIKIKQKELDEIADEYRDKIHEEFEANQRVLKAFKATEHIKKIQYVEGQSSDSSEN